MRTLTSMIVVVLSCACSSGGPGGGSGGGSGGTGGGSGQSGLTCSTATLFAGNPNFNDPMQRPTDGQAMTADPPLPFRTVVFSNGQLITHDGQEIWRVNLSDGKLHKLAGTESTDQALITGACASARFANIFHIALASDGSLFVSDQTANTILKVTDPLGAGCTVRHWAGTPMDVQPGNITPTMIPNTGSTDGAGDMAKFSLPERMAVDPSDNVYVWDHENNSIRKIANDSAHTVSTLVTDLVSGGAALVSETLMGGKLYVFGLDGSTIFLNAYDSTGTKTTLLSGRADKFGGDSTDSETLGDIANDGSNLFVWFNGQIFQVSPAGAVRLPALAGVYKPGIDFSSGYDPKASHSASTVELVALTSFEATSGSAEFLSYDPTGKDFYSTALVVDNYVEKIDCN